MRAEVVGGGICGLSVSILLRRAGWNVQVHERSDAIREVGAGIFLRHTPQQVLEWLSVMGQLRGRGANLAYGEMRTGDGRLLQRDTYSGTHRLWAGRRQDVISALEEAARAAGVIVCVGSKIVRCSGSGVVAREDGTGFRGDLVVVADGHTSSSRDSMGLTLEHRSLASLATRFVVPLSGTSIPDARVMYWSGSRRIGVAPCGPNVAYVYLTCPADDSEGSERPLRVDAWSRWFPAAAGVIKRVEGIEGDQRPYPFVKCRAWHSGRVVVIGDAAHAQPPTLGQGVAMGLSNAWTLVHALTECSDVPSVLERWELKYRSRTETSQRMSVAFDAISARWPARLYGARAALLWLVGHLPVVRQRFRGPSAVSLPEDAVLSRAAATSR